MPQAGLLILDCYIWWVQCLDSKGNSKETGSKNWSVWNTWYFSQHKRQLQLPHVQTADKLLNSSYIQRVCLCFWDGGFYGGGFFWGGGVFLCKVSLRNKFPTWCQQGDQIAVYTTNIVCESEKWSKLQCWVYFCWEVISQIYSALWPWDCCEKWNYISISNAKRNSLEIYRKLQLYSTLSLKEISAYSSCYISTCIGTVQSTVHVYNQRHLWSSLDMNTSSNPK